MIVGTAGHVDHGKSALVRALTGVDPDRLAEEKRRGITLDLGFAYMPGPDGEIVGFVDVPGHEDFIHNMLAGISGVDFVLLTVACDDGVMPQTREHVAILDLLGVSRGVVALTKSDLVPAERRDQVAAAVRALLAPTSLAGAAVVATSTLSGDGIETLRNMLFSSAKNQPARSENDQLFRLPVDRVFTLRGVGTVVTGTGLGGVCPVGTQITISPPGLTARVRSIHAQNRPADRAAAGQRCALALAGDGIAKDSIARGDMVLDPALHAPTARIDARLRLLASETEPVRMWLPVRLHHGAAEVGARLVPLDAAPLECGGEGWVQLVLDRPIAAAVGDRFVLRDTSARRTIGGGRFVDLRAPARRRRAPERRARLAAMALPDPAAALPALLELPPFYLDLDAFRRDRALPASFSAPANTVSVTVRGGWHVLSAQQWVRFAAAVRGALAKSHERAPDAAGMPVDTLRQEAAPNWLAALFAAALGEMAARQELVLIGGLARLSDHAARWNPAQRALWDKVTPLLSHGERFRPPRLGEIAARLGSSEPVIRELMKRAARLGLVEEVAPDHFFLRAAVIEMAAILGTLAQASRDGQFGAAQLRDRLDTGRKNAIELLEYFDRRGVTMRRGDLRRIDARKLETLRGA